jgi:phosphoglycerate dehydrogenase-like enzyme
LNPNTLLVAFDVDPKSRQSVADVLDGIADAVYLTDIAPENRAAALRRADAILSRNIGQELQPDELPLLAGARLLQTFTAGVDHLPLRALPPELPVASNGGAFAEPMAEHGVAMALAAAKRLFIEHANLVRGEFNQFTPNRTLAGGTCGILGFGGIGAATARLMRCLGMKIHALSRSGRSDEPADWIGTPDRLDELLAAADVLVLSLPLTPGTEKLIGARELSLMKRDAILVNLARGEILDEAAFFEHLKATPTFTACIDAWWIEPVRHGHFRMDHPFLTLPNVIGSPHNSAAVRGSAPKALLRAVANCRRALAGETPHHLVREDERMI